jgi:hypothetical protein
MLEDFVKLLVPNEQEKLLKSIEAVDSYRKKKAVYN